MSTEDPPKERTEEFPKEFSEQHHREFSFGISEEQARLDHLEDVTSPLRINSRHRRLMYALAIGLPHGEAAKWSEISRSRVTELLNSPLFRTELAMIERELGERLIEVRANSLVEKEDTTAATLALEVQASIKKLVEIRDDDGVSPGVQQKSAMTLLDRAGVSPRIHVEAEVTLGVEVSDGLANAVVRAMVAEKEEEEGENTEEEKDAGDNERLEEQSMVDGVECASD